MRHEGTVRPSGRLGLKVIRAADRDPDPFVSRWPGPDRLTFRELLELGAPDPSLSEPVNRWRRANFPRLLRPWATSAVAVRAGIVHVVGRLYVTVFRADGRIDDYGLASLRLVTTVGVGFVVDAFQNLVELENMKFHGLGTGVAAEAVGDTALGTELTTQYNPDNTRATGSTTESAANVYRTVGTNTLDAAAAVTEHGVLSQAATGGGVLFDRSVFSVINLSSGDGLQSTYDATFPAGG